MSFLSVASYLICFVILVGLLLISQGRSRIPRLFDICIEEESSYPMISMIIPACNEEKTIHQALEKVLELDYPNLEVIVINDRSTDKTGEIIGEFALKSSMIQHMDIKELPQGWLGKNHALAQGLQKARGEWVLFTDADVHFHPTTLKKAVQHCKREGLDFLSSVPDIQSSSLILSATQVFFVFSLLGMSKSWELGKKGSKTLFGSGSFNFARRSVLQSSKGLEWIRMEVADDMGIAYLMKEAGGKCGIVSGYDCIEVEWYEDLTDMIQGGEKNLIGAIMHYRVSVFFGKTVPLLLVLALLIWSWFSGGLWLQGVLTFTFLCVLAMMIGVASWMGHSKVAGLLGLFGALVLGWMILRSCFIGFQRGGITWRGTFYPLEELKKNQRLRF